MKVTIRFRGRQIAHTNIGMQIMLDFAKRIEEIGNVERRPLLEGRHMIMILAPKAEKKSFAERSQERKAQAETETVGVSDKAAYTQGSPQEKGQARKREYDMT